MTRAATIPSPAPPSDPAPPSAGASAARVGALHRRGDSWRLVVVESSPRPRLIEAITLIGDTARALSEAHQRSRFGLLVRVAPGRGTIARSASVPAGRPEETAAALGLLAEAQLPGTLPPHRRAAGVIADGSTNGTRAVLMTGWDGPAEPAGPMLKRVRETWTTEIAALAVLRGNESPWAACTDAAEGSVSVLATGPDRTAARVLVEDAASPARFRQSAARVVAETCAAVGLELVARDLPGVAMDPRAAAHLRATVTGVPDERMWLEDYGIALGAALTASSTDPLSRGLASMLEAAPRERASPLERTAAWLARPRHAGLTLAAVAALMLLGPLAFAGARLAILQAKSAGLADRTKVHEEQKLRTALYEQLRTSRWPMTKLLADATAAAPVGVTADTITINGEQGVTIQGTADNPTLVNQFQANLNATRLFGTVKAPRVVASGSGVEFDLTATITNPHARAAAADDFAAKPLAVRLYGEGASNTTAPRAGAATSESPRPASRGSRRAETERPASAERSEEDSPRESRRPSGGSADQPPPPLTDAEIGAMNLATASKEHAIRKPFLQRNPNLDAAAKARLEDEIRKLRERQDAVRGGAP